MQPLLTRAQCRAARGLLDWTQEELAERADVSRSTVRDFENGRHELQRASALQIVQALEQAGVVLIAADRLGSGVRLRGPDGETGEENSATAAADHPAGMASPARDPAEPNVQAGTRSRR